MRSDEITMKQVHSLVMLIAQNAAKIVYVGYERRVSEQTVYPNLATCGVGVLFTWHNLAQVGVCMMLWAQLETLHLAIHVYVTLTFVTISSWHNFRMAVSCLHNNTLVVSVLWLTVMHWTKDDQIKYILLADTSHFWDQT